MKKVLLMTLLILVVGCGEKADDSSYDVVNASDSIFTFEDLESIGFKEYRTYDVSELEGSAGAYYGFWGEDENAKKDYEIRFYTTHEDAVSLGEALAQEATGNDAVFTKSDATWKEGIKDRRRSQRTSGTHPKYGNYSIYGNIVMLCEGQVEISLEVCWNLISALEELE